MSMRALIQGSLVAVAVAALAGCAGAAGGTASPPPASTVAQGSALPTGFPLGSWTITITEEDLRAGGITDAAGLIENTGTFTKTYAPDGTWTVVQETSAPVRFPIFRGTYRASGPNEIEETTTFPTDFAGDVVRFTWQPDGTGVRFGVVNPPDPILPILTESHAWQPK